MPRKYLYAIIAGGAAIILIIVFFALRGGNVSEEYSTVIAGKGTLNQTVTGTGTVVSSADIQLNFKTVGRVDEVPVEVGDEVRKGEVIMKLENEDLYIQQDKAEAVLALAKANLEQRIAGASVEDVNVSRASVEEAQAAVEKAQIELDNLNNTKDQKLKQAELDLDKAQLAYDNAKLSLDHTKETTYEAARKAQIVSEGMLSTLINTKDTTEQNITDAYDDMKISMADSLVTVSAVMTDADNIIGYDNVSANDDFEANLGVLKQGTKSTAKNAYVQAKNDYEEARSALLDIGSESSYDDIDGVSDLVKAALDSAVSLLFDVKDLLNYTRTDSALSQTSLATKKATIDTARSSLNSARSSFLTARQAILSVKLSSTSSLTTTQTNYDRAVQDLAEAEAQTRLQVDAAKSNVETAKNNLDSAKEIEDKLKIEIASQIKMAEAQLGISKASLKAAQAALALKTAEPRDVDLASLRAQVREAQAAADVVKNQLADSIIKSPVDGVITAINFDEGEQTSMSLPAIAVLGRNNFQIEVDVPEADIAKVELGDEAKITFDAFGEDNIFNASVSSINPAETLVEGVVYYKVKCEMDDDLSSMLKKGMTANVTIMTDSKEDVVMIPQRAVFNEDGKKMVNILNSKGELEKKEVEVGIRGDDGMVEIMLGVNEGDEVVTFIKRTD